MLFSILFLNLVICLCVKNNSWGKLSELNVLEFIFNVVPSLSFTAVFNLLNCKFDNLALLFIVFNHFIYTAYNTFTLPLLNSKTVCFSFSKIVKIFTFALLSSL